MTQQAQTTPPTPNREWFWRIMAALMLAMAGWVGWVAYQIMPPTSLVTPAAYQALAQARSTSAAGNIQEGLIRQAQPPAPAAETRLRLADTIQTPIQEK